MQQLTTRPQEDQDDLKGPDLQAAGRANVRAVFWQRLDDAGVIAPKKKTRAQYDEMRERLVGLLAYMNIENLATLANYAIEVANGAYRNHCPGEVTIRAQARSLQSVPIREHPIYTSWVRSIEGPSALAGGHLVELALFVKDHYRAPSAFEMREIKLASVNNARRLNMTRERRERGNAMPDDLAWAEWYTRQSDLLADVVREGIAHRAAAASPQKADE